MDLVSRYLNMNFAVLVNNGSDNKSILGVILKPGDCLLVDSGVAHTMKGMLHDDSLQIRTYYKNRVK